MAWLIHSPLPAILALLVFLSGPTATAPEVPAPDHPLVVWAEDRFDASGLVMPDVTVEVYDDTVPCRMRRGLYFPDSAVLRLCTDNGEVLIHELAHAWAEANLTDRDQAEFVARRGLPTWDSHDFEWERRGTEHAAEIIGWALAEDCQLVRWVEDDGEVVFRLFHIPDSEPSQLIDEYRRLTGLEPVLRDPAEWAVTDHETVSPELARAAR